MLLIVKGCATIHADLVPSFPSSPQDLKGVMDTRGKAGELDAFQIVSMLIKVSRRPPVLRDDEKPEYEDLIASLYGWISEQAGGYKPNQVGADRELHHELT